MDEYISNKNKNPVIKTLLVLFVCFLIIYISRQTGLYEFKVYNKTRLTENAIKEFEKDINEGKNVNLKDYIVDDNIDYSNSISRFGTDIGNLLETIMNDGIKKTLKFLSALFYE